MSQATSGGRIVSKRGTGKSFWLGVVVGVLITVIVPLLVLATGVINMGAMQEPGAIERSVASLALNTSTALRAPDSDNPFAGDPSAIETGMTHFRDTCLLCHGAPGIEPREFARGLNPDPPELSTVLADWTDGELFWLTKHGIRMTGMPAFGPTHSDEDVWRIIAFVRQLSDLTADQREVLQEAAEQGHRHGDTRDGASSHSEGHNRTAEGGDGSGDSSEKAGPTHEHGH